MKDLCGAFLVESQEGLRVIITATGEDIEQSLVTGHARGWEVGSGLSSSCIVPVSSTSWSC